jgi:YD repeat-containing protein
MRLEPLSAPITGYVYDEKTGLLKATLNNENFATYYTYDGAGRLTKVEKETAAGVKKVSETFYQYGRP